MGNERISLLCKKCSSPEIARTMINKALERRDSRKFHDNLSEYLYSVVGKMSPDNFSIIVRNALKDSIINPFEIHGRVGTSVVPTESDGNHWTYSRSKYPFFD